MSYEVLARKWRPKTFDQLVGQEHVARALVNALDQGRLHHAYLFTGTRGVGKTTIARILARCLNCEQGVSSQPCGVCSTCQEINEGRFVDLIEVDAASRTKVEDTREILDNVQYAPTRGRYKVYLIDEVHMLSTSSFNALLKTLEEPPPHVKFLLATTDPQKLPVTILSRCLQFSLKAMAPERIVRHLENILEQETIRFEEGALWALARAADGSMRDAMSLTDQAIAFGNGALQEADVAAMLGSIDRNSVFRLVDALATGEVAAVLQTVADLAEQSPDYGQLLEQLIGLLHRLSVAQAVPDGIDDSEGDRERILALAGQFTAEDLQLYYQTALLARRDLPYTPDPRAGLEMALLRMLLFKPAGIPPASTATGGGGAKKPEPAQGGTQGSAREALSAARTLIQGAKSSTAAAASLPVEKNSHASVAQSASAVSASTGSARTVDSVLIPSAKEEQVPPSSKSTRVVPIQQAKEKPERRQEAVDPVTPSPAESQSQDLETGTFGDDWSQLVQQLDVQGALLNFARNCALADGSPNHENNHWTLILPSRYEPLQRPEYQQALQQAVSQATGRTARVDIQVGDAHRPTPDEWQEKARQARLQQASRSLEADPLLQEILQAFDASLDPTSIQPIDE